MPRKPRVPPYCLHKASGQAVVRINGPDCYLGRFGSDENHAEYARVIDSSSSRSPAAWTVLRWLPR